MKVRRHFLALIGALALVLSGCKSSPPLSTVGSPSPSALASATDTTQPQPSATVVATPIILTEEAGDASPTAVPASTIQPTLSATPAGAQASPTVAPAPSIVGIPAPPPRDLIDLQNRLQRVVGQSPPALATAASGVSVGSESKFWVANQQSKSYFAMSARLATASDHAYWYVQDEIDVASADLQNVATFFENQTYPIEHRLFGSEWSPGIDNDVHVVILIGHIPGVGGYFSTADEYPIAVNPYSNQHEMIYINVDSVRPGSGGFNGTVAHEFMHMIQFNVHRDQNSWINEGTAELAAQAVTGAASGGVRTFERQPQTQLNAWSSESLASLPHYGATYLFMRYIAERFGGFEAVGKIVRSPARDVDTFQSFFGSLQPPQSFDQIFADWVAANYLDDTSLGDGRYGYKGIQVHPSLAPGPGEGQTIKGMANQLGVTYYKVSADVASVLEFNGATDVALIGADPHQAPTEWWSNHGDSIDSRLTRTLDLSKVRSATLHFWTWFDIENGFDYGYVEASEDDGKTWTTLAASDTTAENPNGQNYGHGFTGGSGGKTPTWVPETADLTAFAGKTIELRFEYVTDDSYNADGMAIDNVEVPEIGFSDLTADDDGWTAEGFTRITNHVSQRYLVESLDAASNPPVKPIAVGSDGSASVAIRPGVTIVLAVGGLTPSTIHQSSFTLTLSPR